MLYLQDHTSELGLKKDPYLEDTQAKTDHLVFPIVPPLVGDVGEVILGLA